MTRVTRQERSNKEYTRVTPRSLNRFALFVSHDKTNGTRTTRQPEEYANRLGLKLSLKEYIIQLSHERGRKIIILDGGCGSGTTVDLLLSDKELEDYIERIHGVSLHYFENIKSVMEKHTARFYYYAGTVQDVLANAAETFRAYDFIMDVWGAYSYSEDKLGLLKQYHQALNDGGVARVYSSDKNELKIKSAKNRKASFFSEWSAKKFPDTFEYESSSIFSKSGALIMRKTSARWPLESYDILSSQKVPAYGTVDISREELQKQNALKFSNVVLQAKEDQGMVLRPLQLGPRRL